MASPEERPALRLPSRLPELARALQKGCQYGTGWGKKLKEAFNGKQEAETDPKSDGSEQQATKTESLIIETINVSSALKNKEALLRRRAHLQCIHEHCLNNGQNKSLRKKAAKKAETCTTGCTTEWSPPYCGADSACQASETDECSFQCIEKPSCEGCLYEYMIGDELYCDCNKKCDPPRFDMFWSCDNTG